MTVGAAAHGQTARQPLAGTPVPAQDRAFEAAKAAFERRTEPERKSIQRALVWSGDYSGGATGTFGRLTFEGVKAFQGRAGFPATGILDARTDKKLAEEEITARLEVGFSAVTDSATGIALWAPVKLLPKRGLNPNGGARFQSQDDRVTLDLRALPGGEAELKELYERNLAIQTPGRTVTYKLLRPDFFVISGETASGRFYTRFAAGPPGLRGFSIGYDKSLAPRLDRVVVAIANDFEPFPVGGSGPASVAAPAVARPPPREFAAVTPPAIPGLSGIMVGPRQVVTASAIEGCAEPQVSGARARIVRVDTARGLALLETAADRRAAPSLPLATEGPSGGDPVVILFIPTGENGRAVATTGEVSAAGRLVAPLQDGAAGALVVDRGGAVVGAVARPALGPRAVAGLVPPASHPFVAAADLRDMWGSGPPAARTGDPRSVGALAAGLAPAIVAVTCPAATRPR